MLRLRAGLAACLGLAGLLLASCGGSAPRAVAPGTGAEGGNGSGDFMGVTRARCAQGDDGACRILRAMGP